MTIAFVRNHTSGGSSALSASVVATIATNTVVGDLLVAWVSFDNGSSTTPVVSGLTKTAGETATWSKIASHNSSSVTSNGGCRGEMWVIKTTVTWTAGTTITASLDTAKTAKTILLAEFSGVDLYLRGTPGSGTSTVGTPTASTSGTALVAGDLVIGAGSFEPTNVSVDDADTTNGSWSVGSTINSGGAGTVGISAIMQYKIVTAAGVQTYNPTLTTDSGAVIVALAPVPPPQDTMSVSRVGAAAMSTSTASTPHTATLPQAPTAGNLLLLTVNAAGSNGTGAPTCTAPAGWTAGPTGGASQAASMTMLFTFWKVAVGGDAAPVVTIANETYGFGTLVEEWSGLDPTSPFDVSSTVGTNTITSTGYGVADSGPLTTVNPTDWIWTASALQESGPTFLSWGRGSYKDAYVQQGSYTGTWIATGVQSVAAAGTYQPSVQFFSDINGSATASIAFKRKIYASSTPLGLGAIGIDGAAAKGATAAAPITLDIAIAGAVVRTEGPVKPTAGAISLGAISIAGTAAKAAGGADAFGRVVSRKNLCLNPSFETDFAGWFNRWYGPTGAGTIALSPGTGRNGGTALRKTWTASGNSADAGINFSVPVIEGKPYSFSMYVRSSITNAGGVAYVAWGDNVGATISVDGYQYVGLAMPAGAYTLLKWENAIAPAGATTLAAIFGPYNAAAVMGVGDYLEFDQCVIEQSATVNPYFDGSTPADPATGKTYSWAGTPNASVSIEQTLRAPINLGLGIAPTVVKAAPTTSAVPLGLAIAGADAKSTTVSGSVSLGISISGTVSRREDNSAGLMTRLVAYSPNGALLGPLPAPQSWDASVVYGDLGALSVEYSRLAPMAALFADPIEVAFQVFDGHEYVEVVDGRFLMLAADKDDVTADNVPKYYGISQGFRLTKAVVSDGPTDGLTTSERRFTSSTAGRILKTLLDEAQLRGALVGCDFSTFSATLDSAGNPWSLIHSIGYTVGVNILTVLESLTNLGMVEARWVGRSLRLYDSQSSSVDQTVSVNPLVLRKGRDITDAPRRSSLSELADTAIVRGDNGLSIEVANATAVSPWGRWETVLDQGGVDDPTALASSGLTELVRTASGRDEHTHGLNFILAASMPFVNYSTGDYLFSDTANGSPMERLRVRQITLSGDNSGITSGNVVLNDRLVEADVALAKRMNGVQGGATNAGPIPATPTNDSTIPLPPTALAATTAVYMDGISPRAQLLLTWLDPVANVDSSPISDLFAIQVWAKPNRAGMTWRLLTTAEPGVQTVSYSPLETTANYSIRLTALDVSSHVSGYSNVVTLDLAADTTSPPTPSAPTADTRNGAIEISFDGKDSSGFAMPIDHSHVEVYAYQTSAVPTTSAYLVGTIAAAAGSLTLASWPYSTNFYAKFVAVDYSGNKSAVGAVSAGVTNSLVGQGDIGTDAVGPDELGVAAIDNAGNLVVNQLDGKTINGVTINGGLFKSATSGGYIEMGNTGLGDPVDEIRMFNSGTVSSIRNPTDMPGGIRFGLNDGGNVDLKVAGDGHHVFSSGATLFKFLSGVSQVQVRNAADSIYGSIVASAFTVGTSLKKYKDKIKPVVTDTATELAKNGLNEWEWKDQEGGVGKQYGLLADDMPAWMRDGEGYQMTAVTAFLWESLKQSNARIAALEAIAKVK